MQFIILLNLIIIFFSQKNYNISAIFKNYKFKNYFFNINIMEVEKTSRANSKKT